MSMFQPAGHSHRKRKCEGALLPLIMEYRLVHLRLDGAVAVRAAEVLPAVHFKSFGDFGKPVPIIESRVTSSASFSSFQPSVPAGRIGTTRYRISAVESQMRISGIFWQRHAKIGQDTARVCDGARTIGCRFVPDRGEAQHRPRITRAQRAYDHVVKFRCVLQRDDVFALAAGIAEFADGGRCVLEKTCAIGGVGPSLGDDARAITRTNLFLVGLDQQIERGRVDIAFFG